MKHLFLTTSMTVFMLLGCNTQSRKIDSNKLVDLNDLHSLPTEDEWKAAALRTELEWKTATLPTENDWKKAAAFDKKSNGKE